MHRYRRNHAYARTGTSRRHFVAPAAVGTHMLTKSPALRAAPRNSFKISNRELCFPVIAQDTSPQYSVTTFPIQPGLSSVFPLLSNTSKTFVRYKIKYCIEFVPNVGTSTPGTIFIASDTNINENPPSSPSQLMSYAGAISANIWSHCSFPSNKRMNATNDKKMFIRYGSLGANEDIKLYDTANIHVALSGTDGTSVTAGSVLGQLYINYVCTFYEQRLEQIVDSNIFTYYEQLTSADPLTPLAKNAQTALDIVYGSGDVLYTGQFAYWAPTGATPPSPLSAIGPGCTIVFPSQGYYLLIQDMAFVAAGTFVAADSIVSPQPFAGMPYADGGANSAMQGNFGSSIIISPAIVINGLPNSSVTEVSTQTLQIVQVLESGTYISGANTVVGNSWISKGVGLSGYSGSPLPDTNESQIYNYLNTTGSSTVNMFNVSIEVTAVDPGIASYYFPTLFSATPGPLASHRSLATHHRQASLRGLNNAPQQRLRFPIQPTCSSKPDPEDDEGECEAKTPSFEELQKFYQKYH